MWWLWIWIPSLGIHYSYAQNHKIEIFRYVYLTWNIETSTNIVPVLGAIQADLTYRVYNISRSNWMFKHPWDSWNRMQFIVQARSPPATSRRPKAEGLRTRAKRAAWTRSVFVSKWIHPEGPEVYSFRSVCISIESKDRNKRYLWFKGRSLEF